VLLFHALHFVVSSIKFLCKNQFERKKGEGERVNVNAILDIVKGLVFDRVISLQTGKVFEFLLLNSTTQSVEGKLICELPYEVIRKHFKLKDPAFRFHIRQLESKGLVIQTYVFKKDGCEVHVEGHKAALQMGIRAIKHTYITILEKNFTVGGEL